VTEAKGARMTARYRAQGQSERAKEQTIGERLSEAEQDNTEHSAALPAVGRD
jgi:hypothetical protein